MTKLNIRDTALLQERLDSDQNFIKGEHRKPKSERSHKELSRIKDRSNRIKNWLN